MSSEIAASSSGKASRKVVKAQFRKVHIPDLLIDGKYCAPRDFRVLKHHGAICGEPLVFWSVDRDYNSAVGTVRPIGPRRHEVIYRVTDAGGFVTARMHYEFTLMERPDAPARLCVCARVHAFWKDGASMLVTEYSGWPNIRDHATTLHSRPLPNGDVQESVQTVAAGAARCPRAR